jgi:4-alpha-glucanotransferase
MRTSVETFTPSETYQDALKCACALWGIQEDYWDIFGQRHIAPPDVLQAILASLGVAAESRESLNYAVEERLWEEWSCAVPPTHVVSVSDGWMPVHVPAGDTAELVVTFSWEDGGTATAAYVAADLEIEGEMLLRDVTMQRRRLPLPPGAPLGYHTVRVQNAEGEFEGRLILCPDRAYTPAFLERGGKAAGVAVSLYGVRSERNWGCGDFTDLESFADWAIDEAGASFVALNPLHSIPNRQPYNTSPYLPNCSFYRNPIYVDVERILDVQRSRLAQAILASGAFRKRVAALRASRHVEYERVWALKLKFLKLAFREFLREYRTHSGRAEMFRQYIAGEGELLDRFAVYCALDEVIHKRDRSLWIWPDWPDDFRDLTSKAMRDFTRAHWRLILFYKYVQWQLDLQLREAHEHTRSRGMSIGLYHDLALATDRCGSDLWAYRSFYVSGCRVGSPPDDFSPKGQDWAFPPPNSVMHHRDGYRHFVESIRKNCRHGGALRIDHVMRFFRLFWIPDGKQAMEGVYVRDYAEDLVRILTLESVRNRVIVIGEDLGTVEPYIRESLRRHGILSYRLLFFERRKDGTFKAPKEYPREALVSVSTHDLPTMTGFWVGEDIRARRDTGILDAAGYEAQVRSRAEEKQRMLDALFAAGMLPDWFPKRAAEIPDFNGELHNAVVGFLASTPSELMVLNQEDLFKEIEQQNLPGTTAEYPNWRHKVRYTVEEMSTSQQARDCTRMFRNWLQRTGRLNQAGRG